MIDGIFVIDSHVHVGRIFRNLGFHPSELVSFLNGCQIDKAVIMPVVSPEQKEGGHLTIDNKAVLELSEQYPDKLIPIYWINQEDLRSGDKLAASITKNYKGIKLYPQIYNISLKDDCVLKTLDKISRTKLPIFMHTSGYHLSSPESVKELSDLFPEIKMIMYHCGMAGMNVSVGRKVTELIKKNDNIFVELSHALWVTSELIYKGLGARRLVYGSDTPFGNPFLEILKIKRLTQKEEELELMLGKNVSEILKI